MRHNTHRRFCYVEFETATQAHAAAELDGADLGNNLKLLAKISNPAQKQDRHGAMSEGRELYLANVDWDVDEKLLKHTFSKYGYVESARVVKKINGQSRGIAFVVFRDKENADRALEMNLTRFCGRILNVSLSTNDKSKRQANHIVTSTSTSQRASNSPAPTQDVAMNGDGDNVDNGESARRKDSKSAEIQARTIALMNIPDTVNDARIRAIGEEYGELVRVVLQPSHQGAILEYKDARNVGQASLGLAGREISPGHLIAVGTVAEMKQQRAEKKTDKIVVGGGPSTAQKKQQALQPSMPIRRPNQLGARRGGKGGLGIKGGGVGLSGPRAANSARTNGYEEVGEGGAVNGNGNGNGSAMELEAEVDGDGDGDGEGERKKPKSNAEFRKMLLKN